LTHEPLSFKAETATQDERLQAELQSMVRELQRSISGGDPPAEWRARRMEVDDLQDQIRRLRAARLSIKSA